MSRASSGMGSFGEATAPRRMTRDEKITEARELVPDEPLPFVLSAAEIIRYRREPVTREAVLARLVATGKTKAQIMGEGA